MNEGKKDRRDPIRTIKARNPVAKNASAAIGGGAAGAHKDKKKAAKQGEVKHKKTEYAEHLEQALKNRIAEDEQEYNKFRVGQKVTYKNIPSVVTAVDYDDDAVKIRSLGKPYPNTGDMETEVDPGWKFLTPERHYNPNSLVKATSRESQMEEFDNPEYNDEAGMAHGSLYTLKRAVDGLMNTIDDGDDLPEWCQEKISLAEDYLVTVWDYLQSEKSQGTDPQVGEALRPGFTHRDAGDAQSRREKTLADNPRIAAEVERRRKAAEEKKKQQGVAEGEKRMSRAAKGNEKYGKDGMKALAKAGREGASEKKLDAIRDKHDNYNEGLKDPKDNPCWKGYKPVGTKKKGGKTVPNCVPKESWTHDSLASRLFETENTYEDRLANLLKKQLGK